MTKKSSYNTMSTTELITELGKERARMHDELRKPLQTRTLNVYRAARKNIARIMTAQAAGSTNDQK